MQLARLEVLWDQKTQVTLCIQIPALSQSPILQMDCAVKMFTARIPREFTGNKTRGETKEEEALRGRGMPSVCVCVCECALASFRLWQTTKETSRQWKALDPIFVTGPPYSHVKIYCTFLFLFCF